jgi:ketosteroid isomerase-like protein
MNSTLEIGRKLVELCKAGKTHEAIETLYSPNIVSVEAMSSAGQSPKSEGIAAVRKKTEWWESNHEVHSGVVTGPWPHGDRFIVGFKFDVTAKAGPMAGKRMTIDEAALYTVKDDKIIKEEFFYHMGA